MFELHDLAVSYGGLPVLRGVTLQLRPGAILGLLGRNGAGRSTLLQAVMGLVPASGRVVWQGQELLGRPAHQIARAGLGYVPERRDIFPGLSVRENLALGLKPGQRASQQWPLDVIWQAFPALAVRRDTPGGVLSGGEQQMLTLARTLQGDPAVVLVDEPTEGLAPAVVAEIATLLRRMRAQGLAVLLVEQKLSIALDLCDRVAVLGQGRVVFDGTPAALRADVAVQQAWLGV
ncbi:MAG: ABC transporter ATP-binding protein [Rubrivivax sp.]|nr:ABC transporter ATP-binding protein [Rubrivivax sp.]